MNNKGNCKGIKKARIDAGLTQKHFSELFEIPIDVVKSWDSGRRNPPEWAEKLIIEKIERMTRGMSKVKWSEEKIKEAAKDFSRWQGKAVIMVDTSDGDVWTDVFASGTDFKRYHSDTVFRLHGKDDLYGRNGKITAKAIKELLDAEAYKYGDIDNPMPGEVLEIFCRNKL